MHGRLVVAAWLALALLAGCVRIDEPASGAAADADGRDAPIAMPEPLAAVPDWRPEAEPPVRKVPLSVGLELQEPWVRPRQPFEAIAHVPDGAALTWYVTTGGADAFAELIGEYYYVAGAASDRVDPGHNHGGPPHVPVDTGSIEAGASTRPYSFAKEGRYVIALADAPGAMVNVTADAAAAPRDVVHVTIVQDAAGLRVSPSEVHLHPGTRVRFWNVAGSAHALVEQRFMSTIARDAPFLPFIAVDPGAYEIVAIARDGEAWGEARAPLVIDFNAPSSRLFLGPYVGRISSVPTPGSDVEREHTFRAAYPMRSLRVELDAGSAAPVPMAVTWTLARGNETLFEGTLDDLELELTDLPAGEYVLGLRADGGVAIDYSLLGEARHRVDVPVTATASAESS